jgi:uncharacterized membrane protein YkgB
LIDVMVEEKRQEPKPTLKEIFRRNRLLFRAIMLFPVVGMIVAIGVLYMHPSRNLPIQVALMVFLLVQYVISVFLISRRMDAIISA